MVRDAVGDYWIVFSVLNEAIVARQTVTGNTACLDFGLTTFVTLSDKTTISAPQPLLKQIKQLRKSCGNVSRKKKGSNGRRRARLALARLYRRIASMQGLAVPECCQACQDLRCALYRGFESAGDEGPVGTQGLRPCLG